MPIYLNDSVSVVCCFHWLPWYVCDTLFPWCWSQFFSVCWLSCLIFSRNNWGLSYSFDCSFHSEVPPVLANTLYPSWRFERLYRSPGLHISDLVTGFLLILRIYVKLIPVISIQLCPRLWYLFHPSPNITECKPRMVTLPSCLSNSLIAKAYVNVRCISLDSHSPW